MSTMALTRCMLSSQGEEGADQAPCQRTLPRPTQRARLPTHACRRARTMRTNPPTQGVFEPDASPSATSTKATLHATMWFGRGLHSRSLLETVLRWPIAKTSRRTNCRPMLPQDLPHQPHSGQQRHPHVPSVALADCAVGLGFDQLQHGRWHF
eukprot:SAG31_NODE_20362_length_576_cov_3.291405_1_plen_152_part_01